MQMDLLEEAMESGEGSAPEGALGELDESADGAGMAWVAPAVALGAVAIGGAWFLNRRRNPDDDEPVADKESTIDA